MRLTEEQLFAFCQVNREWQIEQTAKGDLAIMSPAGGETSKRNADLITYLNLWAKQDKSGIVFDSSGGFKLPNGAIRSPDVAWVKKSRLQPLTARQKEKFIPLCPDFVIELRSPTDHLPDLQAKMAEYMANGAALGWLIDPEERTVWVSRPGSPPTPLLNPTTLTGSPLLPGFTLHLADIWQPDF